MSEYRVGYGKPPKHSRFKIGNRVNPKGRPKPAPLVKADIIDSVLNETAQYTEGGRTKTATRRELMVKRLMSDIFKGDMKAAVTLLKLYAHAQKYGDGGAQTIEVRDWLPDYPGQTAEQKTREFESRGEATAPEWWRGPDVKPPDEDT